MSAPISEVTGRLTRAAEGFWEVEGHGVIEVRYSRLSVSLNVGFRKDGKHYDGLHFLKFQQLWQQGKTKKL